MKRMKYDLTVIIPVYNMEKLLVRCLDSIVTQTSLKDCSLRVICVNDGSTDGSQKILEEYSDKYTFIEYVNQNNGGVSAARNTGLDFVKDSEYITFIDPDDSIYPDYIEKFILNKGQDVLYFDFDLVDSSDRVVKSLVVNPFYSKEYTNDTNLRYFLLTKHASWTRIYKSKRIGNFRFPLGKIYEDIALMPFISSRCTSVTYIKQAIYRYTVNTEGSIMNSSKSNIFDIYDSLTYLFDLFGDQFDTYKEELQYLAIEHLCVGHTYRLLHYANASKKDFKDIVFFMEKYFGKQWNKNKYVKRGVQKVNINSSLSKIVPIFLVSLKYGGSHIFSLIKKIISRQGK
ncbi:glycosyltransferase family 2 protein [Streptococcus australis]|jgi:polysaccharide biosynthesis protein, putative rhamnosyl transferase|uniref:glycosyltransferase family 2 protein n=1 Tax=Streptococcus australis TaxID=113107 RepID=UPI0027D2AA36|nr:glycosyltransferase [Streptococcus australis]